MPFYVLQIAVVGLFVHSVYFRPLRTNALFALFVFPFAAIYADDTYIFGSMSATNSIGGWPAMNFLGFLFTFYVALALCVSLARRIYPKRVPIVPLGVAMIAFVTIFGVMMELLNEYMHWWSFLRPSNRLEYFVLWHWRPVLAIPPFLALLLPGRRTRRTVFAITLVVGAVYMFSFLGLRYLIGGGAGEALSLTLPMIFWVTLPILAHRAHRRGTWNLEIDLAALQFARPISLGRRLGRSRK